jgi:hypothetical protein
MQLAKQRLVGVGPESEKEVLADSFNNNNKADWLVASAVDNIYSLEDI